MSNLQKYLKEPWLYEKPWYKPGKWDVSPLTFRTEVRKRMPNLPKKVLPTDTTLREGTEMAGVYLHSEEEIEVATMLANVGIKEIDCGYAGNPEQLGFTKSIIDAGVDISTRLIIRWIRGKWKEQIDDAVSVGVNVIKTQTPSGLRSKVRELDYAELLKTGQLIPRLTEVIKYIKDEYPDIYIQSGFRNTSQADLESLQKLCKVSVDAGADRISLSDGMGVGSPPAFQYLVEELRKVIGFSPDIQVHCHNDFGMAVADTIGAVQGGCTSFDCTINGIGDRAGNAPLEECVVALELLYGVDTGVKLEKLYELSRWMEEKSGITMARTKAVTGPGAFLEESHLGGKIQKLKWGYTDDWFLPFAPSVVGRDHVAVWGSTSILDHNIHLKLDQMGISDFTDQDIKEIRRRGWEIINTKRSGEAFILDEDFEKIIKAVLEK